MSDVNAAATLSLAVTTGTAKEQIDALRLSYSDLKSELAKGLPSTGISKEAADQIQKLGQQVQTLQSNLKSMATEHQAQIAVLNSNYEKFEKARVAGQQKMADAARASTAAQSAYAANATKLLQERAAAAEVAAAAERRLAEVSRNNASAAQSANAAITNKLLQERAAAAEVAAAAERRLAEASRNNASAAQSSNVAITNKLLQERAAAAEVAAAAERRLAEASRNNASAAQSAYAANATKLLQERAAAAEVAAAAERRLAEASRNNASAAQSSNVAITNKLLQERAAAAEVAAAAERRLAEASRNNASAAKSAYAANATKLLQERAAAAEVAAAAERRLAEVSRNNASAAQSANAAITNKLLQERAAAAEVAAAAERRLAEATRANASAAQSAYAANATKILQERAAAAEVAAAAERRLAEATRANAAAAQAASHANTARLIQERAAAVSGTSTRTYNPLTNTYTTTPAQVATAGALSQNMSQVATATGRATVEQHNWNKAAKDGHAFARGLSGSLGALWMTYGNLAPLMAGAALAGGFKAAVKAGSEFAYQLTFVKALGGETAQAVAQIGASALELSKTSMYGPGELANGLRMLSQAGLSARDSLLALPVAMNLATVGEMNMEQATLTLVGVMNAFGMGITDLTHIGDMFSKAAALSQTSVSAMTEAMKTASVVHDQYGASIEDTATAITLLAKVNITGTAAGTSYRNMLKDLYTPSKEAARVMEDLGIKTKDASGKLRDAPAIIADLKTKLQGFTQASQTDILGKIFSERGGKEAIQMLGAVGEEWDTLKAKISNSEGFMAGVTAELEMTTKGRFKQALNTMQANMVSAFDASEGPVRKLADALRNLADSPAFVSGINAIVGAMAGMATVAVSLTPVILGLGTAFVAFKASVAISAGLDAAALALKSFNAKALDFVGIVGPMQPATMNAKAAIALLAEKLTSVQGSAALAAIAVGGLWYVMHQSTAASDAATKAGDNFIGVLDRSIKKINEEIATLKERNRLMRAGFDPDDQTASDLNASQLEQKRLEAEIAKRRKLVGNKDLNSYANRDDRAYLGDGSIDALEKQLAEVTKKTQTLSAQAAEKLSQSTSEFILKSREEVEKFDRSSASVVASAGTATEKARAAGIMQASANMKQMLLQLETKGSVTAKDLREYKEQFEALKQQSAMSLIGSGQSEYVAPNTGAAAAAADSSAAAARRRANKDAERDEKATIASYTERQNAEIASLASRAQNKLISEEQNQAELAGIYAKYNDVIAEQYAARISRLKTLQANAKADEKDALKAEMTETETAQAKFESDKLLRLQKSKDRELGIIIKTTGEATKAFLEEQKAQVAAQIESINEAKAKLNMGPGESAAYDAGRKVDAEFRKKEADLKAQINNLRESLIAAQKQASGGNLSEDQIASVEGNKVLQDYLRQLQEVYDAREALKAQAMDAAEANASYTRSFEFGWKSAYKAYADEAANSASKAQIVFQSASRAMEDAVTQFVTTGKVGWRDLASTVLSEAARVMASKAVSSMLGMATNFISGLFSSSPIVPSTAGLTNTTTLAGIEALSANGNVFSGAPSLHQYANTVQDSPKVFAFDRLHKYAKGGVFAEAGPEAVMPLARDSNGRLGVRAQGGSGTDVAIYLTVNEAEGTTSAKSSGDANGAWAQFATRIKGMILEEMTNQKRPGGLLYA